MIDQKYVAREKENHHEDETDDDDDVVRCILRTNVVRI